MLVQSPGISGGLEWLPDVIYFTSFTPKGYMYYLLVKCVSEWTLKPCHFFQKNKSVISTYFAITDSLVSLASDVV